MENQNSYTGINLNVSILFDNESLEYLEKYRKIAAEKGLNLSLEKFIETLLEVGSIPYLKRQAAFFVGGEIV